MSIEFPHDEKLERAALGCLVLSPEQACEAPGLARSWFYSAKSRIIYQAIADLLEEGESTDIISLMGRLRASDQLEAAGGMQQILSLARDIASPTFFAGWAAQLQQLATARELIQLSLETAQAVADSPSNEARLSAAYSASLKIAEAAERGEASKGYTTSPDRACLLREIIQGRAGVGAIKTGWPEVTNMLNGGWQKGKLYVIAARPGMGKSAFVLQSAACAALNQSKRVFIANLEMTESGILTRWISHYCNIGVHLLAEHTRDDPTIRPSQIAECLQIMDRFNSAPLYISDSGERNKTLPRLFALIEQCHRRHGLDMVIIDYIQLLHAHGAALSSRQDVVSHISRSLKILAGRLKVPVIALAQLNRKVEERADKRPMISDLRESGAIEQDADAIILLYREAYYGNLDDDDDEKDSKNEEEARVSRHLRAATPEEAEVIVGKHREGATGTIRLHWQGAYAKFISISRRDIHGYE